MPVTAVALDIGTSGIRALAIDCEAGQATAGASTAWHPLPGTNLIDHLIFSATFGPERARRIVARTINELVREVCVPHNVESFAVCGNTGQLSLFTGTECRDLIMSPASLDQKGIRVPDRHARVIDSRMLGLEVSCDVLVPPAVRAEVGADALALIHKSGMRGNDSVMAMDLGTNAEMALSAGGKIYVCSAAAGPAIEGQHISHGMLAAPGAIAGIAYNWGWTLQVLDRTMSPVDGDTIDLGPGTLRRRGPGRATGITGTGVIALVSAGLAKGIIVPPRIHAPGGSLPLQDGIVFTEPDLIEAGKAFGAIRAGQQTLADAAGIDFSTIHTCHIAGTAGSFADPLRARDVGIIPASAGTIIRHGNTSLEMAADLAAGSERLETLQHIADKAEHVALSESSFFSGLFIHELAHWCEGAPRKSGEGARPDPVILHNPPRWTVDGARFIRPQYRLSLPGDRDRCGELVRICPNKALAVAGDSIGIDLRVCQGASCLRCQRAGLSFGNPED